MQVLKTKAFSGQDMNPTMLDIFLNQTRTPKVIVGDPNQQIYMFRGAVNALDMVEASHIYHLTQSFRFGPEIAFAANCVLDTLQKQDRQTLVGGKKLDFIVCRDEIRDLEKHRPIAFLARTNLTLLKEVIKVITK